MHPSCRRGSRLWITRSRSAHAAHIWSAFKFSAPSRAELQTQSEQCAMITTTCVVGEYVWHARRHRRRVGVRPIRPQRHRWCLCVGSDVARRASVVPLLRSGGSDRSDNCGKPAGARPHCGWTRPMGGNRQLFSAYVAGFRGISVAPASCDGTRRGEPGLAACAQRRPAGRNGPGLSTRCPPAVIVPAVDCRTVDSGPRAPAHVDRRPRAAGLGPTTDPRALPQSGAEASPRRWGHIRFARPLRRDGHVVRMGRTADAGRPKARLRRPGVCGGGCPCGRATSAGTPALLAGYLCDDGRAQFGVRRLLLISKRSTLAR
ncbi:hypothetical protein FrEUN1fDRAFT_0758 [Parafrankia sp. EUN1f]|nr:hypothetical protein FrEUN1fDRAFT_0758 [Parafrankia sp. EUN1f]